MQNAQNHVHQTVQNSGASDPVVTADTPPAKVVPVTPLPFRAIDRDDLLKPGESAHCYWEIEGGRGYLSSDGFTGFCLTAYIHADDARYIVHAANAYPKLIKAIRIALDPDAFHDQALTDAQTLLRELGEI